MAEIAPRATHSHQEPSGRRDVIAPHKVIGNAD